MWANLQILSSYVLSYLYVHHPTETKQSYLYGQFKSTIHHRTGMKIVPNFQKRILSHVKIYFYTFILFNRHCSQIDARSWPVISMTLLYPASLSFWPSQCVLGGCQPLYHQIVSWIYQKFRMWRQELEFLGAVNSMSPDTRDNQSSWARGRKKQRQGEKEETKSQNVLQQDVKSSGQGKREKLYMLCRLFRRC